MRLARSILLSILSIPIVLADPSTEHALQDDQDFNFQELLAVLPAESLHAALHKHVEEKFKDGVFEHEHLAVQKVHSEDPGTATKVLAEAALHMLKRQVSNDTIVSTTTTPIVPTTTTPAPSPPASSSATPAVIVPVVVTTTNSQGQSTTLQTSAVAVPTVSIVTSITTTNAQGSTITAASTIAAAVVTASNGDVVTTTVPTFSASTVNPTQATDLTTTNAAGATVTFSSITPGAVRTATDGNGNVFVTTYTPNGGTVSSLVLRTTQLPDGRLSTVTSFALVAADTAATASSTSNPKLQSGAATVGISKALKALVMLCVVFASTFIFS